ncbi:hypothetical protein PM082_017271 [Marasmius tenuissimus]|nr:hypothetical protein PM082_017271 [Marasmius tenuissimus]
MHSFVRRLKQKDRHIEIPSVPNLPPHLGSLDANESSSGSFFTKEEAKRKKEQTRERREELAVELRRRETSFAPTQNPTARRPSRRDDVSFFFGIPDDGFSM